MSISFAIFVLLINQIAATKLYISQTVDANICTLPQDIGPCDAIVPRYYYNSRKNACEIFNYGGCRGNQNNFQSERECQFVCDSCNVVCKANPCDITTCTNFPGATCSGNCCTDAIFTNSRGEDVTAQCEVPSCWLPMEIGRCRAAFPRWYFDSKTQTCQRFTYGGCGGNSNNFETELECKVGSLECCNSYHDCIADPCSVATCSNFPDATCYGNCCTGAIFTNLFGEDVTVQCEDCSLAPDAGPCEAAMPRWYYDATTNSCKQFIYGGCEGNSNNFENMGQCVRTCHR